MVCAASASPRFPVKNKINPIILVSGPPTTWCGNLAKYKVSASGGSQRQMEDTLSTDGNPQPPYLFQLTTGSTNNWSQNIYRKLLFNPQKLWKLKTGPNKFKAKTAQAQRVREERREPQSEISGNQSVVIGSGWSQWSAAVEFFEKVGFHTLKEQSV